MSLYFAFLLTFLLNHAQSKGQIPLERPCIFWIGVIRKRSLVH